MRVLAFFVLQAIAASTVLAGYNNPNYVPGAFIVKFKDSGIAGAASSATDRTSTVDDSAHVAFESFLTDRKIPFTTRFKFTDSSIFHGHSIMLSNPDDVKALKAFENVDTIYPVRRLQLHSQRAVPFRRRNETSAPPLDHDDYSAHVMTGIDKIHAQRHFGSGIKVGIIDSGIDYTHDALNGNLGYGQPCYGQPGCPVAGGAAFVQDDGSPNITDDPRPRCGPNDDYGHGTHTGGTIVASPRDRDAPGVAPQAQLYAYRIFGCKVGGTGSDLLIAAIERAYKDGVDLISMSLGGAALFEEVSVEAVVVNSIVEKGIPVVVSTGNDGSTGLWYADSPALARNSLSVGAVTNTQVSGYTATVTAASGESRQVTYLTSNPFAFNGTTKFQLYATSKGANYSGDACEELPDSTPDLSDKVAFIGRGGCGLGVKAKNAAKKGAKYVIIYNREDWSPGTSDGNTWPWPRSAGMMSDDGLAIVDMLSKGDVTIDFAGSKAVRFKDTKTGNTAADFTEYAIPLELRMGVSISGVGSFIESTWPDQSPSYVTLQGTSMSCPQVAGVVALYRQVHGKQESPLDVRSVITTTGTPVVYYTGVIDTVARHGGGLVNAVKAVSTPIRLHPDRLELNDTAHLQDSWTVTLSNKGDKEQHYTVAHLPAGTIYTFEEGKQNAIITDAIFPVDQDQAQLSFEPASFSVPAGGEQKVNVKVQPPAAVQSRVPVYSGYVQFKSDDEMASVHVPYVGVAAEMSKIPVFNATSEVIGDVLPALVNVNATAIKDDAHVFSLADYNNKPTIMWQIVLGSKLVKLDLVKPDTTFVPTNAGTTTFKPPQNQRRSNDRGRSDSGGSHTLPDSDIVASLVDISFAIRGADNTKWDAITLDATYVDAQGNNQTIPDGTFRLALRALKLFKNGDEEDAWESYVSPAFTIKKA